MIKDKVNLKYFIFIITIYLLIFQKVMQSHIGIFRYFDEILAFLSLFVLFIYRDLWKLKIKKYQKNIIICLLILLFLGLLGNVCYQYQNFEFILRDIIVFFKFYSIMFATSIVYDNIFLEQNRKKFLLHINIISFIFILATFLNYIFKYNPSSIRYGIMSNQIFYDHPTYLAAAVVFLVSFRIALVNKIFDFMNIALLLVLASTLRIKALGAVLGILLICLYIKKTNQKISIGKLFIIALPILLLAFNQFRYYFFDNDYARGALLTKSFTVASDHFPIGTGFATYGSYFSGVSYSPVYHIYDLNEYYGLTPENPNFVSDVFWPMIIGQFGFIGLFIYLLICFNLYKSIQTEFSSKTKYYYISKIFIFAYLMISSTSESAFTNPIVIPYAIFLGILIHNREEKRNMKFINYLTHPSKVIIKLLTLNLIKFNDEQYVKMIYYLTFKKKLDLNNPQSLNEKLQWLKLYDRKNIYTTMVDKFTVKDYVSKIIDKKYIIPTIGVYENFDEIDFEKLPNQFVIKCTHDSGGLVIVEDKCKLDIKKTRKKIEKSLKINYFHKWREWPYKNVKPKIIIEKFIGNNLVDYKIQCFNGKPDNILVCKGRNSIEGVRYYYFDTKWNFINYCPYDDVDPSTFSLPKPENLDEMLSLAEKISTGYLQMRVDFYNINGKIYFGEITLFSEAGFDTDISSKADQILGQKFQIPKEKIIEDEN